MTVLRRQWARPDYGLDAPPIVYGYTGLGVVGVALIVAAGLLSQPVLLGWGVWAAVLGFVVAALMVYSSKVGKIFLPARTLTATVPATCAG